MHIDSREWTRGRLTLLLAIVALGATPALADLVPGGPTKSADRDCYGELDVTALGDMTVTPNKKGVPTIACQDGTACDQDGQVNDECVIQIEGCANQNNVEGCTPPESLESFTASAKVKGTKGKIVIEAPQLLTGSVCGAMVDLTIPVKVNNKGVKAPGKGVVKLKAKAPKGTKPRTDKDKITFQCLPNDLPPSSCSANAAGGPDHLKLTVAQTGNDLDNGWTGISQNFAVTPNGSINVCLSDCNLTDDTECTAAGTVGAGSENGVYFGAPLPLLAGGVPVCVVNRYKDNISGTANLGTGDIALHVTLLSDVYFTDKAEVCPRCTNNKCSSGNNAGKACVTEATLTVAEGLGNKTYNLSTACPPTGAPVATLDIDFNPLTSGQTGDLVGEIPCPRPSGTPPGVPPQPNACSAGCGSPCTGSACVSMEPDPINPAQMVCVDNKGGISQVCCNDNTTRACFPLENGGILNRTGRAEAPTPLVPDATFPKMGTGTLASVFCEAATGTSTIDLTTGLPGPAALLLTGTQEWSKLPPP